MSNDEQRDERRHVFSVLTENKPGVLARVAGLISARGFNIESLSVGETETPDRSRMTVVVKGPPATLEQVRKQLEKLIDTVKVTNLTAEDRLERGLALLKLRVPPPLRAEVMRLADIFHARVMDIRAKSMILEITGSEEKIDRFVELLADLAPPGESNGERAVERAVTRAMERLAAGLGAALDRDVTLPTLARSRPAEPGVSLLEMVRTGRIALKKDPD